jgi:Na+-driven multidrug efflux pump
MRRFVNADIVAGQITNAVTLNRFAYANGNPAMFVDPTGLSVFKWMVDTATEWAVDKYNKTKDAVIDICNTVVKLFTSLGVGMIACMPFVFPILINSSYNEAFIYIPFLALGVVFNVGVSLYSSIYIAKKMTKQVAATSVMGAIINIVVNVVLIKFIGLWAA